MAMLSTNNNITVASHHFSWEIPVELAQKVKIKQKI
jgi:hypothetical protein